LPLDFIHASISRKEFILRIVGHPYSVLTETEANLILDNSFQILEKMGMVIQNRGLLKEIGKHGWLVDFDTFKVNFPSRLVKKYIEEHGTYDWSRLKPNVSSTAGVYHGLYLDPFQNSRIPWTEELLVSYFNLAKYLPLIDKATMLGCRLPVPPSLEPLYERLYCWKYGAQECGSIYLDEICPYLLDLYQVYAEYCNKPIDQVFRAGVFVVPHLKLGTHEAAQVEYFWERGLKVSIGGGMPTMGGTTPVTFAGSVALNLAEQLALNILDNVLYGVKPLYIEASISVMDMRTGIHPFGRPEQVMTNLMTAQIARMLGASFSGHAGLTDAKTPSAEAGYQKMMTAITTFMASGSLWIDAGLLSADEVYSPIQMILDHEMLSVFNHLSQDYTVDESAIGLQTILNVGPGGHYMDRQHTADYFRKEHWQPEIWSRHMLQAWIENGSQLDVDKARNVYSEIQNQYDMYKVLIPESLEMDLLAVIDHARERLT
jgi:trimethylamine--corrinoid protein Co-methyltransferase